MSAKSAAFARALPHIQMTADGNPARTSFSDVRPYEETCLAIPKAR